MPAVTSRKGLVAVLATVALLPLAAVLPAAHAAPPARTTSGVATAASRPASDHTSTREARRVDRVPTPKLGWYPCYGNAECATVELPLDYDQPRGAKTEIAVLRVTATDQEHKIGSLFVNPGGPGGSGVEFAAARRSSSARRCSPGSTSSGSTRVAWRTATTCGAGRTRESRKALVGLLSAAFPVTDGRTRPRWRRRRRSAGRARRPGRPWRLRCRPPRWPVTWTCCAGRSATSS